MPFLSRVVAVPCRFSVNDTAFVAHHGTEYGTEFGTMFLVRHDERHGLCKCGSSYQYRRRRRVGKHGTAV